MQELAPSILAADYKILIEQLEIMKENKVEILHIDLMDGQFVPNFAFGIPMIEYIRHKTDFILDVHLMIQEPKRFVQCVRAAGADMITVHVEACEDIMDTLNTIKSVGAKAGVALCPETSEMLITDEILDKSDSIHFMSVAPGVSNQNFIEHTLKKIENIKNVIAKKNKSVIIEVDGGINAMNIEAVCKAGADIIVCGTALFQGNLEDNILYLKNKMK